MNAISCEELEGCGLIGAERRNESEACPECNAPTMLERRFLRFATNEEMTVVKCEACGYMAEV